MNISVTDVPKIAFVKGFEGSRLIFDGASRVVEFEAKKVV